MAVNNLNSGVGIQPTIVDAKGDLIAATANDAVNRLAVGTNGQVLVADSGETTGLKWNNPGTVGGLVHIETKNTGGAVSSLSFDNVFTTTYSTFAIVVKLVVSDDLSLRVRAGGSDFTASNYRRQRVGFANTTVTATRQTDSAFLRVLCRTATGAVTATTLNGNLIIQNPAQADLTALNNQVGVVSGGDVIMELNSGVVQNTTSYDGFTIFPASGTMNGDVAVYAYKF
jgi:hypothetical protein